MATANKRKSNDAPSKPDFSFSDVGYKWVREYVRAEVAMTTCKSADDYDAAVERRDGLLCQVLTNVPADWLLSDAPAVIDWGQIDSLDYIQAGKVQPLIQALREAMQPDNASGN